MPVWRLAGLKFGEQASRVETQGRADVVIRVKR